MGASQYCGRWNLYLPQEVFECRRTYLEYHKPGSTRQRGRRSSPATPAAQTEVVAWSFHVSTGRFHSSLESDQGQDFPKYSLWLSWLQSQLLPARVSLHFSVTNISSLCCPPWLLYYLGSMPSYYLSPLLSFSSFSIDRWQQVTLLTKRRERNLFLCCPLHQQDFAFDSHRCDYRSPPHSMALQLVEVLIS